MSQDRHVKNCKVCRYGAAQLDFTMTNAAISRIVDCSKDSVLRHRKWAEVNGFQPAAKFEVLDFHAPLADPSLPVNLRVRRVWEGPNGEMKASYENVAEIDQEIPAWPVIDRPAPLRVTKTAHPILLHKWKTAVVGADTQIGFRRLSDGSLDPFHDDKALSLFNTLVEIENPTQVVLAGDIIDLPEQGRFAQEASFAGTTQAAIDRTYEWLFDLRERTSGQIHLIEGNHDKRLQNFVETNALSAFGLKRAGWADHWPVMSIPYLLRLDELGIDYYDSYPNAHVWINNRLRAEHGTKANSRGSTAQKYLDETPHVSRVIGHSHRQEIIQRTTWDRLGKIKSQVINPGCLCRVDGAVPSFHGSIGANGKPAAVYEDWQQGAAIIRYTDDEFFSELVQFEEGTMVYQGNEYVAP